MIFALIALHGGGGLGIGAKKVKFLTNAVWHGVVCWKKAVFLFGWEGKRFFFNDWNGRSPLRSDWVQEWQ